MDLGLKGKKAIVTGGTRGIGRAIANLLVEEGCDIGICARTPAQVEEAVAAFQAKGVKAFGSALDVADGAQFTRFIKSTAEALGGLDIFISNVSALGVGNDEDSWRNGFEIDVLGTLRGCETALPFLEKSGGRRHRRDRIGGRGRGGRPAACLQWLEGGRPALRQGAGARPRPEERAR